jgi:DnaJ-class molecular chaperone
MNDDLYNILQIPPNSSIEIIKKAYKKLSLKYHPDKQINSTLSTDEKNIQFIKIKDAYEILKNPIKKAEYDKKINKTFHFSEILNDISQLINDDYKIIFSLFKLKFTHLQHINNIQLIDILDNITNFNLLDIEITVDFTLSQLYNVETQIITHNRLTKNIFKETIYPIDNIQIYENEGEIFNNNSGNLTIKVNITDNTNYQILNNDLYIVIQKSSIENNIFKFTHLDTTYYEINIFELDKITTDFGELYFIKKLGLPYYNTDDNIIDVKKYDILRGNLYILLNS